MTRHKTKVCCI
ncbi:MAG TPA: hypothetical protein DD730_20790 [Desulfosporosinus sp.]|nr:hypothetical protein [Desulfosporosinus sp.]